MLFPTLKKIDYKQTSKGLLLNLSGIAKSRDHLIIEIELN